MINIIKINNFLCEIKLGKSKDKKRLKNSQKREKWTQNGPRTKKSKLIWVDFNHICQYKQKPTLPPVAQVLERH